MRGRTIASRRSAAPVTASRRDPFRAARLRLTLLYIAILAAVVALLSASLYELSAHDAAPIGRRRTVPEIAGEEGPGLGEFLERLGRSILFADAVTILVGGGLCYLLAARTLRPIKESFETKQRFFANAAHDLRTPLSVMRTEAEVALRTADLDAGEARKVIASSLEEIGRMAAMAEGMLSLARSGRPGGRAAFAVLDLSALARGAAAKMARRAEERGIGLAAPAGEPAMIHGDAFALERAVYNVLENAIAYTPAGGRVEVGVRRHGGRAVLSVSDTGLGMAPEDLAHLGEPFYRGDRARSAQTGGAGLGLAIVKAVVEEHGGSLRAVSRPGEGTTVFLSFPAVR